MEKLIQLTRLELIKNLNQPHGLNLRELKVGEREKN